MSPLFLKLYGWTHSSSPPEWAPWNWRNLQFPNPLGISGGVDKNAQSVTDWWALGAGFIEIGTVTPYPQKSNPGTILNRDLLNEALWNRMGFPNQGVKAVKARLQKLPQKRKTPLFANIGKNRATPLNQAAEDYITGLKELSPLVDGFVVNISSPNTQGLRQLLDPSYLKDFLQPILQANILKKPILLKLSPDLEEGQLESALQTSVDLNLDGWILTNTTVKREPTLSFPKEGGVSGRPLASTSLQYLKKTIQWLGADKKDRLVISSGGVLSSQDIRERLHWGADLVQVYSALVLKGPFFFKKVAREILNQKPLMTHPRLRSAQS